MTILIAIFNYLKVLAATMFYLTFGIFIFAFGFGSLGYASPAFWLSVLFALVAGVCSFAEFILRNYE